MKQFKYNWLCTFIFSYFAAYSLVFGIILSGFENLIFLRNFVIYMILDLFLFSIIFRINKLGITKKITNGFKISLFLILILTSILGVLTYTFNNILGPTEIKLSENQTLIKPNEFLVRINILSLLGIIFISLTGGVVYDRREKIIQKYLYFVSLIDLAIVIALNYLLFYLISTAIGISSF